MRRREFIGVALSALALPSAVLAEKAIPLVGWLSGGGASNDEAVQKAFDSGLSEFGYKVGGNVRVEYRYANGKYDQLQSLADELVGLHVDALVAVASYPVILAAKRATSSIPIFLTGVDPIRFGLVQSMNKPGGNLTGVVVLSNELKAKQIELFQELLPTSVPIAVLVNPANPTPTADDLKHVEEIIRKLGREAILVQASNKSEIETAFATVAEHKAALLVWDEAYFSMERALIVSLAERHSVPCFYGTRRATEIGGLISYGANFLEMIRLLGKYTGKVLRGTLPADLPVMQPTKHELVINLKTAKALGLTVPPALLVAADEVIE